MNKLQNIQFKLKNDKKIKKLYI